jgi:hypothetical protein
MADQIDGIRLHQGLATGEDDLHGAQPVSQVVDDLPPLRGVGILFARRVLPDIAVQAARGALLGQKQRNRGRTAQRSQTAASYGAQSMVNPLIQPFVQVTSSVHYSPYFIRLYFASDTAIMAANRY